MGRAPCCDKANVKKGPWSPEEDAKLKDYIDKFGTGGNWIALPQKIGLRRCGKSCRLRWLNYLRPNIKHGGFSEEEDNIICNLYISIGSRWSIIAAQLPGRTDNDIKNYWNTRLKKKLLGRRKQSNLNRLRGGGSSTEDPRETLSNSAIERLQLHMQLQSNESCPLSLWPQLSPLQEKMIQQSLHLFNGSSNPLLRINASSPTDDSQKLDQLYQVPLTSGNNPSNPMLQDQYPINMSKEGMENSTIHIPGSVDDMLDRGCDKLPSVDQFRQVSTFQAELDDLLGYKGSGFFPLEGQVSEFDCFKEVDGSRDITAWWTNNFDTNSLSSTSWDSDNSVIQRHHESGVSCQEMV